MTKFIADETFKGQNYTENRLPKAEYDNCVFEGCDFSNGYVDNQSFTACEFIDCNLSNANIAHTTFNEVVFSHCKMLGLKFEDCNDFLLDFSFDNCRLNLSSFYGLTLKSQNFKNCKLIEVDFTGANLSGTCFENCDLDRAIFSQVNLEKTDFTSALNFSIDPEQNRLKNARFTKEGLAGLLTKYQLKIED